MGQLTDAPRLTTKGEFRVGTLRGREGFVRVAQNADGRWTLVDAAGEPFYCRAVHGVRRTPRTGDSGLPPDSAARLRSWGLNAIGLGGDEAVRDDGLPFFASVEFCEAGPLIVAPGARLPDVFDPGWPQVAAQRAEQVCHSLSDTPDLIGWVTDNAIDWAQPSGEGRPTLLQICLSLEPAFAAYHAAWEFVLALHGGRLESVARSWGIALRNKEVVRELARAEMGIATRGYWRDEARWTREFARRYFTTSASAIRAVDPNHLVFGCRFRGAAGAAVLAECTYPALDVSLTPWTELPPAAPISSQPVLAGEVCWVADEFWRLPARGGARRLTSVERMLKRARATLERMAKNPAVVGYVWTQWQDEPGEQPPFARGLVHVSGAEAREHTELLAHFNARVETLRASTFR